VVAGRSWGPILFACGITTRKLAGRRLEALDQPLDLNLRAAKASHVEARPGLGRTLPLLAQSGSGNSSSCSPNPRRLR
jgi:hypothetical protein